MGACDINKNLLPVKFTYFFELAAVSSLLPYLNVYMRKIGLTYSELSIIYGLSPFVTAILRTLIGILADKVQKHKEFIIVCCVFSGIFHGLLMVTPKAPSSPDYGSCNFSVNVKCSSTSAIIDYCIPSQDVTYTNGNLTVISDPFLNASSCSMECLLPKDAIDSQHYSGETHTLSISQPPENQSTSLHFVFRNGYLNKSADTSYSQDPNCLSYVWYNFTYKSQNYSDLVCTDNRTIHTCHLICQGAFFKKTSTNSTCSVPPAPASFTTTFWVFFTLFIIGQIFFAPIFSLIDALVYNYLGKEAGKWGRQRLWGTIGFATFAIISGFLMDSFIDLNVSKAFDSYLFAFILFGVLSIIGGVMVLFYRISGKVISTTIFTNLGLLLRSPQVLMLLCNTFMFGLFTGIIETFLFVRLSEIGAPQLLMGLCMVINCLPEIVVLLSAGFLISRVGIFGNVCIVYVAYCTRLVVYAFLTKPWYTLLVEPLHGITFGLMYATVSFHANDITPPGMHGTMQSLIGALYFGFGKGTGSLTSGQVYQMFGPKITFIGFAVCGVVCLALFVIIHLMFLRRLPKKKAADFDETTDNKEEKDIDMKLINHNQGEAKNNEKSAAVAEGNQTETDTLVQKEQPESSQT